MYMGYERYEKNQIICKYGDKGRKAYIVLQGKMDILIKQNRKMRIIEHDYINYIAALLRYQEYGLLSLVLKENYEEYPLEIIDPNKKTKEYDGDNTDKERENVQNGTTYFTWKASECKKKEEVIQLTPMQLLQMIEPKYKELCRRFLADNDDFSDKNLSSLSINKFYINEDLQDCINNIKKDILNLIY